MTRTPILQTTGSNCVATTVRTTSRFALRRAAGREAWGSTPARAEVSG
ncbi:hypothetical protein [Haloterrigena salinisoli]